jgi:23S rRNA (adenine2503-C2)-methyltransferase
MSELLLEKNTERLDFYCFSRSKLAQLLEEEAGFPSYRAGQIFDWVYRKNQTDFTAMTNIKKSWRDALSQMFSFREAKILDRKISTDGTRKYLLEVSAEVLVEAVMIKQPSRTTLCLSSQQGCSMGCKFCFTGTMGFLRNLSTGDIVRQVIAVQKDSKEFGDDFQNIVFMGMGEPLRNLDAVADAVRILKDDHAFKLGPRKITVSTVGLVSEIEKLSACELDVNLAVSLNATTDQLRSRLMPVNRSYNIAQLLDCLKNYPLKRRRKITIEYVLLSGVNDSDADLNRLVKLLDGMKVKVNLIPYNSRTGLPFIRPSDEKLLNWNARLNAAGINATIRWSRGNDVNAACGQLASSSESTSSGFAGRANPEISPFG